MIDPRWLTIARGHESDEAYALKWWREASEADKLRVWQAIQGLGVVRHPRHMSAAALESGAIEQRDTMSEIISRFAQIGMTDIALQAAREADAHKAGS